MNPEDPFSATQQTPPETPPAQPEASPEAGKKTSTPARLMLAAIIVVVLGAGALAFSYFQNSPQKVIAQMREQIAQITTGKFTAQIDISYPPELLMPAFAPGEDVPALPASIGMKLNAQGAFDMNDRGQIKTALQIQGKAEGVSQDPLDIDLEMRILGEGVFFKLHQLPEVGDLDLSSLSNTWFFSDSQEVPDTLPQSGTENQSTDTEGSAASDLAIVKQFYSELSRLYSNNFKVTKDLGKDTVSGQPVHHYQIAIDIASLSKELDEYQKTADDLMAETYSEMIKASLGDLRNITAQIWIGQKDSLPYRLQFDIPLGITGGQIALTLELSDYNQPVEISEPQDARDFNEALDEVWSQTLLAPPEDLP